MAKKWAKFPHADKAYAYDDAGLRNSWLPMTGTKGTSRSIGSAVSKYRWSSTWQK